VIPNGPGKGNLVLVNGGGTAGLDMNGFNQTINGLSNYNGTTYSTDSIVDNLAASSMATLTVGNNDATSTFSGVIRNSGSNAVLALAKTGTGTLTLSNANSYSGGTTVNGGTLRISNATALGSGGLTVNGGTLDLNGINVTVPAFSGSGGKVTNTLTGTSTLTAAVSGAPSTYAGDIADGAGAVVLIKSGTGTLILSGSLTMAGLNANGGVTQLAQSGSIGAVSIADGATLTLSAQTGGSRSVLEVSSLTISGFSSNLAALGQVPAQVTGFSGFNLDSLTNATEYTWVEASASSQALGILAGAQAKGMVAQASNAVADTAALNSSPESVPEPGSFSLLFSAALGLLGLRRYGNRKTRA